jgi:hypothetical protein
VRISRFETILLTLYTLMTRFYVINNNFSYLVTDKR